MRYAAVKRHIIGMSLMSSVLTGLALVPAARADQENSLGEAALVLGRIIEKKLDAAGVEPASIQWARVPGRGVLYLAGVRIVRLDPTPAPDSPSSESDLAWENARRDLHGEPPADADDARQTQAAVAAVRQALKDFGERLPLPDGQHIRVALVSMGTPWTARMRQGQYSPESAIALPSAAPRRGGGMTSAAEPVGPAPTIPSARSPRAEPAPLSPPAVPSSSGRFGVGRRGAVLFGRTLTPSEPEVLVVDSEGTVSAANATLAEDAAVLTRVLDKKLRQEFPDEFWGVDTFARPGASAVVMDDWGAVVTFNMTFPIEPAPASAPTRGDIWEETARELKGTAQRLPAKSRPADATRMIDVLKTGLADFGGRLRELPETAAVTLLIFPQGPERALSVTGPAAGRRSSELMQLSKTIGGKGDVLKIITVPPDVPASPHYTLQVSGADLAGARAGKLDRDALLQRITVVKP